MIRKIVTVLILVPLALAIVMFAVANRAPVTIALRSVRHASRRCSPSRCRCSSSLLVALIAGVIVGGAAAWSRQSKWRRRARRLSADLKAARARDRGAAPPARGAAPPPRAAVASIAYRIRRRCA